MTARPPGGGPRSLGASLLDDVLAETLDPAYAQAAEARAARGRRARRPPTTRARVLVALTMVVAGLLAAVTYDQAAARAQGRQEIRAALVDDIRAESDASDELAAELEELRARGHPRPGRAARLLHDRAAGARRAGRRRGGRGRAAGHRARACWSPWPTPGPTPTTTRSAATTEDDVRGRVRDGDLQLVVNALWAAGAEAISINGQRLGPTSAIRFAGEAVLVDFRPVTNPYEVSAIGDPETLSSGFLSSPEVGALALIEETYGLRFDFSREDELSLPAASTPELRSAQPVPDEPDDGPTHRRPTPRPETDP